jgi:amino acid transporter
LFAKLDIEQYKLFISLYSYIIGFVIGSGIFITPTSILNHTNSIGLSLIIWVVGGLIAILGGYCYVELGTSIRHSGADFAYICYLKWYHYYLLQLLVDFSRYPLAFSFMCVGCLLNYPALIAIEATAFGEYITAGLSALFCLDLTDSVYAKKLIGFSLVCKCVTIVYSFKIKINILFEGLLSLLNCFSLKRIAAPFQVFTTGAKIISTMIIVCTGFYFLIFRGAVLIVLSNISVFFN